MGIELVLDMAVSAHPDRLAVGRTEGGITYRELSDLADGGAAVLTSSNAEHLVFVGVNGPALPVLTFSAARAGIPLVPLNYRLSRQQLGELINQLRNPLVVADDAYLDAVGGTSPAVWSTEQFIQSARDTEAASPIPVSDEATAIVLFTSGTTSAPKGVLLRHQHLLSYVMQTVEFGCAEERHAALVSTPPYHIAGMGAVLSNIYSGRRMVHLPNFSPEGWLELVRSQAVTSAMVVPTMLARVIEHLDGAPSDTPALESLAYGGARMPTPVLEAALSAFPDTGFVNAYGLTETSSTIAVLGPEDHREAWATPELRHRLGSAGRIVPGMEAQIRDEGGTVLNEGLTGLLWVRGAQVSGEYMGKGSVLDRDGWFPTQDRARIDDGFLFIEGRADDTIIRGGENIAPAEIEDVLVRHPEVREVAVIGVPDDEWGEIICAAIVSVGNSNPDPDEIRAFCRSHLRGSRTPDTIVFLPELPRTTTGKVVRRELLPLVAAVVP